MVLDLWRFLIDRLEWSWTRGSLPIMSSYVWSTPQSFRTRGHGRGEEISSAARGSRREPPFGRADERALLYARRTTCIDPGRFTDQNGTDHGIRIHAHDIHETADAEMTGSHCVRTPTWYTRTKHAVTIWVHIRTRGYTPTAVQNRLVAIVFARVYAKVYTHVHLCIYHVYLDAPCPFWVDERGAVARFFLFYFIFFV